MGMTLGVARTRFYLHLRNHGINRDNFPEMAANDLLNVGWRHVAEDTQSITGGVTGPIVSGNNKYALPANFISVDKVELYQSSTLIRTLYPTAPNGSIQSQDGTVTLGVPYTCNLSIAKHDDSTPAVLEITLYPTPNWNDTKGMTVFGVLAPRVVSDGFTFSSHSDVAVDFPLQSLWEAGIFYACLLASPAPVFQQLYDKQIGVYFRNPIATQTEMIRRDYAANARWQTNWNSYSV
jgi:hypothetical protein